MIYFKENYNFPRYRGGGGGGGGGFNIFKGGQIFSREVQLLIPMETYRTCDFPRGFWTPCPPLWILFKQCGPRSGSTLFASSHELVNNVSKYLQQTASADVIFQRPITCTFNCSLTLCILMDFPIHIHIISFHFEVSEL